MWGSAVTEGRACKPGDGGCRVRAGCESLAAGNFAMRSLPAQTVKENVQSQPCYKAPFSGAAVEALIK